MNPDELRRRLVRIGYITQAQAAMALGLSQPAVSRLLTGNSSIRPQVVRTLELLERDPLPVLSGNMRHALSQAAGPGDPVPYPEGEEVWIARVDWDEVYDGMHTLGLVAYPDGRPQITERGWRALHEDTEV